MSGFSSASGETTSLLRRFVEDLGAPSSYRDRSYQGSQEDLERDLSISSTVYVGNLSFYTTEEQIYALFSKSGPVKRVIMGLDRNQKTPCGFCFVEYLCSLIGLVSFFVDISLERTHYFVKSFKTDQNSMIGSCALI